MGRLFVSDGALAALSVSRVFRGIPRLYHSHCLPHIREVGLRGMRNKVASFDKKPMIILIRDIKDALASYYHHEAFRSRKVAFSGTCDEFVRSSVYGIEKITAYYNLLAEMRTASKAPTLITRYEDLWYAPDATLRLNLEFMGIRNVSQEAISNAIAACSIDNMRRMELVASQETAVVPGLFRSHSERPEALKVRKGGIGNWRDCISEDVAAEIDRYLAKNLDPFFLRPRNLFASHS